MTKEELKALGLNDEQVNAVWADYGKNYVSKAQFNTKNEELKVLRGDSKKLNEELEKLKTASAGSEDLKAQIEKLQLERQESEKAMQEKLSMAQRDYHIDLALVNAKAKNTKAVKALLDMDKLKLEDDKLVGIDEQLELLVKDSPYLFGSEGKGGYEPVDPNNEPNSSEKSIEQEFAQALGLNL